jgi:hypothetical protein
MKRIYNNEEDDIGPMPPPSYPTNATVLNEHAADIGPTLPAITAGDTGADDDNEDIGPLPPTSTANPAETAPKKKRKSTFKA